MNAASASWRFVRHLFSLCLTAMKLLEYRSADFWPQLHKACPSFRAAEDVATTVKTIIADIEKRGDKAVLEYTQRFDGAQLCADDQRVSPEALAAAAKTLKPAERKAIREAIACVRDFNQKTRPKNWQAKNPHGASVGERFYPIQRVGLYVPGGQVPLVSSVVMSAVLAKIAGCPQIVVCTPPQKDGNVNSALLAALHLAGITEVYKIGGVQAIAAMALGTATLPAVDKIFGPGNAYVMEAKRALFGTVGIDLLPGPSEVLVVADTSANPAYLAADLLAQAEHGTTKEKVYLIVPNKRLYQQVEKEIARQSATLSHRDKALEVLEHRAVAIIASAPAAIAEVANYIAPEHMELQVENALQKTLLQTITTAGAVLLGHDTPTVLGDFTAGPSHTLPTDRTGRFFGGMQVIDFMRRSSVVSYNAQSAAKAWPVVREFARMEQLDAHGKSLAIRLGSPS